MSYMQVMGLEVVPADVVMWAAGAGELFHDNKESAMNSRFIPVVLSAVFLLFGIGLEPARGADGKATLVRASVSEDIRNGSPLNEGFVFPVRAGKVVCFTVFDSVPERTVIYHDWYRRDQLNTRIRLVLQPPRWASYSTIQLREIDKGPWRIEVTDHEGRILRILRFSITD